MRKKTSLTRSLLAACSIVALTAVMYGCVHDSDDPAPEPTTTPEPTPEPEPEPEPITPGDLDDTKDAAMEAATAAGTLSVRASAAADTSATATENIATLQTNGTASADAAAARAAADDAKMEADKAMAAAEAAGAATTGAAAEAAWKDAVAAQEAAEAAQAIAIEKSAAAVAAAMTELHIDGDMMWVGGLTADAEGSSSVDASMDKLTSPDGKTVKGFQGQLQREDQGEVTGQAFVHGPDPANDKDYVQAVEGRDIAIGADLDTTDDMARLTLVTGRVSSQMYRVFVDQGSTIDNASVAIDGKVTIGGTARTLKSLGMFIEATGGQTGGSEGLDHTDLVTAELGTGATATANKPVEVFSYETDTATNYVVEVSRVVSGAGATTSITLQPVDITALSVPDISRDPGDTDAHEEGGVTAAVPMAKAYSHINFGVWNKLAGASDAQTIADLGIGFVQNIGEGVTQKQGIGSVTYNGDWVAAVRRQYASDAEAGAIKVHSDSATLAVNFDKGTFKGTLTNLATLDGTLADNGFSGIKATGIEHDDLDAMGTFTGEFSGNIYGKKGEEAAGIFDFDGGEAGAFVGAFGGSNQD